MGLSTHLGLSATNSQGVLLYLVDDPMEKLEILTSGTGQLRLGAHLKQRTTDYVIGWQSHDNHMIQRSQKNSSEVLLTLVHPPPATPR